MTTVDKLQENILRSLKDKQYDVESIVVSYFRNGRVPDSWQFLEVIDLLDQWKCIASQIEVVESMGDYVWEITYE